MTDDNGPSLPTTEEMRAVLEAPLDPFLEYFDATPSIEQLALAYRDLGERVIMLERLLQLQAQINGKLLSNQTRLLQQEAERTTNALILPDRLNS